MCALGCALVCVGLCQRRCEGGGAFLVRLCLRLGVCKGLRLQVIAVGKITLRVYLPDTVSRRPNGCGVSVCVYVCV